MPYHGGYGPLVTRQIQPYEYEPIDGANEIRTVTILPDWDHDADIFVYLSKIPFSPETERKRLPEFYDSIAVPWGRHYYEALSYAWGDPSDLRTIFVASNEGQPYRLHSLQVTRNCEIALRFLRFQDLPCVAWIDAICINQSDKAEKGRQVSIMAQIYTQAFRVTAWLGPQTQNNNTAMDLINEVGRQLHYEETTGQFKALRETLPVHLAHIRIDQLTALADFLEREYFERLWVWQEVRMGGSRISLWCGDSCTTLDALYTALRFISDSYPSKDSTKIGLQLFGRLSRGAFQIVELACRSGSPGMLKALEDLRACKCADQRDRIYISQAFATYHDEIITIMPDYDAPLEDVYIDFARRVILTTNHLHLLNYVGDIRSRVSAVNAQFRARLPSWVPDWTGVPTAYRLFHYHVNRVASCASVVACDQKRLVVHGLLVDSITETKQCPSELQIEPNIAQSEYRKWLQKAVPPSLTDEALADLAKVLFGFRYSEACVPKQTDRLPLTDYVKYLKTLTSPAGEDPLPATHMDKMWSNFRICEGRTFFKTVEGRYGIGPRVMQTGDRLVTLLGNPLVFVLRPVPTSDGSSAYHILGSASCTGLMCHEGYLGPLPPAYEPVAVIDNVSGRSDPQFWNRQTRLFQAEDPRLPPLPKEWREIRYFKNRRGGERLEYLNRTTGELRDYRFDPRLDFAALKSRGVPLEEICLV